MDNIYGNFDIIVVGGGHAGCEAALASARLNMKVAMFTLSIANLALMACNPNIGGTSKGHLVKEVDALGGEMGKVIDKTYIQSKMLNKSKGPAVHSLRAQADKQDYTNEMRRIIENQENLEIYQQEVIDLIIEQGKLTGIKVFGGGIYTSRAVILATGTYLKSRCIYGEVSIYTGPNSLPAANFLSEALIREGVELQRYKTGTPARISSNSIDFSQMQAQQGDREVVPFSFTNTSEDIAKEQVKCFLTYTNEKTHKIILDNIDRSPMYSGVIEGTGPRYCPSIEDKIVKFKDKSRHQVFIEPEGRHTNEMYIAGMSTSLPFDVQLRMYRSVKGLEKAHIVKNAYAIEYDCLQAKELLPTLELKKIKNVYCAGQINGSSGYEEAAAQGLIAGINATRKLKNQEQIILKRSQAYIGVLIDDLCTKESHEPYRMMTSRAEYRLTLRQDNADIRLTKLGYEVGLIDEERYLKFCKKVELIDLETARLKATPIGANKKVQKFLAKHNSTLLKTGSSLAELLKRPEISYNLLLEIDEGRGDVPEDVGEQVEINIKYEGYIRRQETSIRQFKKMESKKLDRDFDYNKVPSLRLEAIQKLNAFKPLSLGQAGRISGVSPADISVLMIYLEKLKRLKNQDD